MRILFIFLCFLSTASSMAQRTLIPSKKSFQKKWLKNSAYQMTWYALRDTAAFEIGKVSTKIIKDASNLTIVTEVSLKNTKDSWVDSTIADSKTLQPVRHASYNRQRDMVLNYGKVVTGFYNDKIKKANIIINDTTAGQYFDSNLYPSLLAWLPLKEGYVQEIAIYDYNPAAKIGVIKAFVKEVKAGQYQTDKNGARDVWIVSVTDEIGNGENGTSTCYFDKIDRRLWKQEINAQGRKMMMKLTE